MFFSHKQEGRMKVGVLQLNLTVGDFQGNAEKILHGYKEACAKGAEIVLGTELALFAYPPKDMLQDDGCLLAQGEVLVSLAREVGPVGLIVGIAEWAHLSSGKPLFNSAVLVQNGAWKVVRRKALLPEYDVFDERRHFEPGHEMATSFVYEGTGVAVLVCEDIWFQNEFIDKHPLYGHDPIMDLTKSTRLDVVLVLNVSPYYWGKGTVRYGLVADVASKLRVPVVYSNQVGGNDDLVFDGRSFAIGRHGECIAAAPAFRESVFVVDTESEVGAPYPHDKGEIADLYEALVLGTRDYLAKTNFQNGAIVALSGGIDSALVACIAVDALGPGKVLGVSMPSKYSSAGGGADGGAAAGDLRIPLISLPL